MGIIKSKITMAQNRIYAGKPDADYEKECKALYAENDENNDGVLVLEEFKQFMINCAVAAGVSDDDIQQMKGEGSDSMWSMMFRQFDEDNDGSITWEECWAFLKRTALERRHASALLQRTQQLK